jgi:hypothetical protein
MNEAEPNKINICIVDGCEGICLYVNNTRIAGPKPWGGGKTIKEWNIDKGKLEEALNKYEKRS